MGYWTGPHAETVFIGYDFIIFKYKFALSYLDVKKGISKDTLDKNIKFAEKYKVKYFLASDETNVCEKLGVWIRKSMYGRKFILKI